MYNAGTDYHAKKSPPTPGHAANPVLSRLSGHSDPIVLKPFGVTQVYYKWQICSRFHWIRKMILEMTFWYITHRFKSWVKFRSGQATAPRSAGRWEKIVQWDMNCGPESCVIAIYQWTLSSAKWQPFWPDLKGLPLWPPTHMVQQFMRALNTSQ